MGVGAIKSHPQSQSRGVRPAAARTRSPRTRSDLLWSSPPPHPPRSRNDPHPIRHPGERRDPWLRRTRRSRAAITRPATMGPGVRRDDGKGRSHKIAPAPATARPPPSSWRKPGSRAASATPHGSGSWVEPRMTEEAGAICLSSSRIARPPRLAHPQHPAPSRHPGESRDPEPQAHPPAALSPGSGRNDDRRGVASYPANLHQPLIRTSPHPSLTSGRN